jgi:GntR family transcriptional regulator
MPVLASGNPVPRYARLAQLLRQRIDKGVWKPGEQLPRLEDLMQEFDVARVTVRQAVGLLAQDGWVSVSRGRGGTIVQSRPAQDKTLLLETSLADMADAYRTDKPTLTLIDEQIAEPPALPADCGPPVPVYRHLRRVHSRDGQPYCVISIYLDESVFKKAARRFRRETIIPVLLEVQGVRIARAHQTLRISVADVETSRLLGVPLNSGVGEVVRVFHDTKGQVMYIAEITYRAEYLRFQMALKV